MVGQTRSLLLEAKSVIQGSPRQKHWQVDMVIHTKVGDIKPVSILKQVLVQDFAANIFDTNRWEVYLTRSVYMHQLYPNRDNLLITIIETECNPDANTKLATPEIRINQYKGIVERPVDINMVTAASGGTASDELDQSDLYQLSLTLQDLALTPTRGYSLQSVITDTPVKSFLRSSLGAPNEIKGVHVVEPTGDSHIEHMLIPAGITLTDLPAWIDKNEHGVYTTGMGYYLLDSFWYVYPLFNTNRINDSSEHTLTVVNVPAENYSGVDNTYGKNGNTTFILCAGDVQLVDLGEGVEANAGNGLIYGLSNLMATNTVLTGSDGSGLLNRNFNQSAIQKEDKATDMSLGFYRKGNTSNHARMMSELNASTGVLASLQWQNSEPSLIYPGMPVRLLHQVGDVVKELVGVVSSLSTERSETNAGMANKNMVTNSVIGLRLKRMNEK